MSKTIECFKEISKIPRESGNEREIALYIVKFAEERNLPYTIDEYNNVIIRKYVNDREPIILQAHLDMVCEKDPDFSFDFTKDSIEIIEENGYLRANHTSLGSDNGVGVAQILTILDENVDKSIEAIFTVSEETTMIGSMNINLDDIKGRKMINLDGFNADTILTESASFTDIDIKYKYNYESNMNNCIKISLSGLESGHSGFDIDRIKSNSILILSELLMDINDLQMSEFIGGTKINVIPNSSFAIIKTNWDIERIINNKLDTIRVEYPNIKINIEKIKGKYKLLSNEDSFKFLSSIISLPHGVLYRNKMGITTSINLATVNLGERIIRLGLRSSIMNERDKILSKLNNICNDFKYKLKITGFQPGFITDEKEELVKDLIKSYKELFHNKPKLESVHISVEVGLIKEKIPDLEIAIISPNIIGAHTTKERVEIDSISKCDQWLMSFLSR